MNCYLHAEVPAAAFCRSCGKPLCAACQRLAAGTIYCPEHAPVSYADAQNPYAQPAAAPVTPVPVSTSPGLAFFLGFIPGVGAIYNGQYLKGLVHAVIFGLICSLLDSVEHSAGGPLLGIILTAYIFYMPFEAYHTAKRRLAGQPVEEFSSLIAPNKFYSRTPIGPILLILIGVFFLLDTLHLVEFRDVARFWPVLLIFAGAFMLYNRVSAPPVAQTQPQAMPHEHVAGEYVEPRQ
jgi:TM2 domain-containing membrane protein YozV